MLVNAKDMLQKAREGKYAVGQFNINNLERSEEHTSELQSPWN